MKDVIFEQKKKNTNKTHSAEIMHTTYMHISEGYERKWLEQEGMGDPIFLL